MSKSQTPELWFKVLSKDGDPIDGSKERWSLPFRQHNGEVMDLRAIEACYFTKVGWVNVPNTCGTWLLNNPRPIYSHDPSCRIFVAWNLSEPTNQIPGVIWTTNVRLIREATNRDLRRFGIHRAFPQIIAQHDYGPVGKEIKT